jgi:hypothetical protein
MCAQREDPQVRFLARIATYEADRPISTSAAFLQLLQRLFHSGDQTFEIFGNMCVWQVYLAHFGSLIWPTLSC